MSDGSRVRRMLSFSKSSPIEMWIFEQIEKDRVKAGAEAEGEFGPTVKYTLFAYYMLRDLLKDRVEVEDIKKFVESIESRDGLK